MITKEMQEFLTEQVRDRFLRYVRIDTTSNDKSDTTPSTPQQWDLLKLLEAEMNEIGLSQVKLSQDGYVYGILPASPNINCPSFALLAHVDTSPDQLGDNVRPRVIENWDGKPITYPEDPDLTLKMSDCPELSHFLGDSIITASGRTLLGADNKAGVAEIMAAMATFLKFPQLPHGELRVCFTPDEEIGRGTIKIDENWLPRFAYTLDGGFPGELEGECFDAWKAEVYFKGVGVHPGYAKDKMVNAITCACLFVCSLPEWQTPEHTEKREGFFHTVGVEGNCEGAKAVIIIRDFEEAINKERMALLDLQKAYFEKRFPGLQIRIQLTHQYQNMRDIMQRTPEVMDLAEQAMKDAGVTPIRKMIRGGTDGARLTQLGHPTPNLFAGGMFFHSKREWIAVSSMAKAVETVLHLAKGWSKRK